MKKVAIVILNWNGKKWLEQFLPSVIQFSDSEIAEIIVADNASSDDSVSFLKNEFPDVKIIVLEQNHGYTGGYNRALSELNHEYFVLLNSDIEVTKNWLAPIIRLMDGDQNIAACQPKILSYNQKAFFEYAGASGGFIDFLAYPFCRGRIIDVLEKDNGQYNDARKIFWATGACLFVRGKVYKELGGLDDRFFAHMEEIDLCWRMQNAGYDIWVEPLSAVYHVGGGTLQADNPKKTFFNFRNNLLMIFKNEKNFKRVIIIFIRLILDGLAAIKFLVSGKPKHLWAILKAHFAFYFMMPHYLFRPKFKTRKQKFNGVYANSIIINYFLKGKKKFRDLGEI